MVRMSILGGQASTDTCTRNRSSQDRKVQLRWLGKAATYYQVIRNLKRIAEGERLGKALDALDTVAAGITPGNVDSTVISLARELNSHYERGEALSAASKLLWIRHRTRSVIPILIYDGNARSCLNALGERVGEGDYIGYRAAWLRQFDKRETAIRSACEKLIRVKAFSPAVKERRNLEPTLRRRWFRERVFDKFLWWNGEQEGPVTREELVKDAKKAPFIWSSAGKPTKLHLSATNRSNEKPLFSFPFASASGLVRTTDKMPDGKPVKSKRYVYYEIIPSSVRSRRSAEPRAR